MSHHLHNSFASGNQSSTQDRYGLGEMDPHSKTCHVGPGLSSPGPPTVASARVIPALGQSVGYRPEPNRTSINDDLERSVDIHISRAREEVKFCGDPGRQSTGQRTHFSGTHRDEYQSSRLHTSSYPQSSSAVSHSHKYCNVESKQSSIALLPKYKGSADDDSSRFYPSPSSSSYTHNSDGTFTSSTEGQRDVESLTGLREYENTKPKYTSQSAINILMRFGLEKEDLEYLISYPEDQLTPSNLPFILRQIRMQKTRMSTSAVESKPYPEPQPVRGSEMNFAGQLPIPKPPQVIDYGHTGKYFGGTGRTDSIGEDSSMLESYEQRMTSGSQGQVQKDSTECKVSTLVSPWDHSSSDTRLSSPYQSVAPLINDPNEPSSSDTPPSSLDRSVAPTSNKPTKQSYNQPSQTSPLTCNSFNLPQKDPNRQVLITEPRPTSFNEPGTGTKPTLPLLNRKGLILIDKTYSKGTMDDSKSRGEEAALTKHVKKEQEQNKDLKKKEEQKQKPEQRKEFEKTQKQQAQAPKQPQSQLGNALWSAFLPLQPPPVLPGSSVQYPVPYSKPDASPVGNLPPSTSSWNQTSPPKNAVKLPGIEIQPSLAMMHDYAAATPKVFPHICSLCFKECTTLKSWISHQNSSLHLQCCRQLRTRYPQWNGEVLVKSSSLSKDTESSSSPSAKTSQKLHGRFSLSCKTSQKQHGSLSSSSAKTSQKHHGSRSHSRSASPNRHQGSKNRKPKRSRSRSRNPRYSRSSSHSPQYSRYRSRSRSQERGRRWRRRSSRTRSSEERESSPKRRCERRSSSRRREDRRSSPEWRSHRQLQPGSSSNRWLSPQRSRERRSPPRRSETGRSPVSRDDRKVSPRHSRDRLSLREMSPERQKSRSAERLVKKLLKRTAGPSQCEADLEAVVKTLLAEITKTKSSSTAEMGSKHTISSSCVSSRSTDFASSSTSVPSSFTSATSSAAKKTATTTKSSLLKGRVDKSSPVSAPTMVRLEGITSSLSRTDVIAALECFGRIKSIILSRKKEQALVCFEKEEDAKKVKSIKSIEVKGTYVTVMRKKDTVVKKTPVKKTATPNEFTPRKTKNTVRKTETSVSKGLKKSLHSQVMKSTQGTDVKKSSLSTPVKTATKVSVKGKGSPGVSRAKVLVSKAKHVSKHSKKVARKSKSVSQYNQEDVAASIQVTVAEPNNIQDDKRAKVNMERNWAVQEPDAPKESPILVENLAEPTNVSTTTVECPEAVHLEDLPTEEMFVLEQPELQETQEAEPTQVGPEVKEAQDTEPAETEETIPVMSEELMETGSSTQEEGEILSNTESEEPPTETGTDILKPEADSCTPQETKAPPEPQADPSPEPKQELETKEEPCQFSVLADVLEKKDSSSPMKNQKGPKMAPVVFKAGESLKGAASTAVSRQKAQTAAVPSRLTVLDMDQISFGKKKFATYAKKKVLSQKFLKRNDTMMLIKNLPEEDDYTEEELSELLRSAGFDYRDDNLYVIPRSCLAFCFLSSLETVQKLIAGRPIYFKNLRLHLFVPCIGYTMTPYRLYKFLLKRMTGKASHPAGTIYVKNISSVQTEALIEILRKMEKAAMLMPFLNKMFVEFLTPHDADLLGVCFSLINPAYSCTMYRMLIPQVGPRVLHAKYIPKQLISTFTKGVDFKEPTINPQGSSPPFWLSINTRPYIFPTMSSWFQIPRIMTYKFDGDARVARDQCFRPTIMLTGLPEGRYRQEDVARLFWSCFPKRNLQTLYYSVLVLILQRRAFIHFPDWMSCLIFFEQHNNKRLTLCGSALTPHFVMEPMVTEYTEERMFIQLLKLSNLRTPHPESLEERLLCVEIAEATVNIVTVVMEGVASIAQFVRFLPLANRICVEMAQSSGVIKVVEMYKTYKPQSEFKLNTWNKVIRIECMKSLKQRLHDAGETAIDLNPKAPSSIAGAGSTSNQTTSSTVDVSPKGAEKLEGAERPATGLTVPPEKVQGLAASNVVHFDEQSFNIDDFITVDEVGEDAGEHKHRVQSARQITKRKNQQECEAIYKNEISTRSMQTSKNLDSPSSPSPSKFPEDYRKRSPSPSSISASPKKSRLSSKSLISPSSSLPQGKSKAQITSFFSSDSRPSSVAKSESAVIKSDHTVLAEGNAEKSVKSEKEIETLSEMSPPAQESEMNQDQNHLGTGFKDRTVHDLEERKDSLKEITEEEEDNYQILDSFEEQTENEVNKRSQSGNSPDNLFPEHGDIFHVLDSVGDDGTEFCTQTTEEGPKCLTKDLLKDTDTSGEKESDKIWIQANDQSDEKPANNKTEANKDLSQEKEDLHFKLNQSGAKEEEEETIQGKAMNTKISNDAENPDEQMAEVQASEQQQSEILPPKEDQSVMVEPKSQNDQEVIKQTEEEVVYQVVDSIKDQLDVSPTEPDNKRSRGEREFTHNKEERPSNHCGQRTTTTAAEKKESDKTTRTEELTEDMEFEVLDSVEDEPTVAASTYERSGRRSPRGKKEDPTKAPKKPEVDDEVVAVRTRSTSRRRDGSTRKDSLTVGSNKEDTPSRRTHNPARKILRTQEEASEESRSMNKVAIIVKEDPEEEATYEIVDSVDDKDDQPSKGKKRKPNRKEEQHSKESSTMKKTELIVREEDTYEILDSLEVMKEDHPVTRRKRGRPKKQEKPAKKEPEQRIECEKEADGKEEVSCQINSLEDQMVDGHPNMEQSKSLRKTRASKNNKASTEERTPRTRSRKSRSNEEPLYQIVDSVEDEQIQEEVTKTEVSKEPGESKQDTTSVSTAGENRNKKAEDNIDHQPEDIETERLGGRTTLENDSKTERSENEGEAVTETVDFLEDYQVKEQLLTQEVSKDTKGETSCTILVAEKTEVVVKVLDGGGDALSAEGPTASTNALVNLDEVSDEEEDFPDDVEEEEESRKRHTRRLSKNSECTSRKKQSGIKGTSDSPSLIEEKLMCDITADKKSVKDLEEVSDASSVTEESSETQREASTPFKEKNQESSKKNDSTPVRVTLVNLDQVSDEEEDFPDDTAMEEEVRKKQAAVKDQRLSKQKAMEQEVPTTRERSNRDRRSRSSSRGGESSEEGKRRVKERSREEVDIKELVTLDEVGGDETGEDVAAQSQESEAEELLGLVTLDEIHEEDDEDDVQARGIQTPVVEKGSSSLEEKPVESSHKETLVSLEADDDIDDKTKKPHATLSFPVKCKHEPEKEEKPTPRTQGRQKRKSRTTAVRKSPRGKTSAERDCKEEQEPGPDGPAPPHLFDTLSPVNNPTKIQKDADPKSQKIPDFQGLSKELSKRNVDLLAPEAKRSRSESPCSSVNTNLPPYHPDKSVGQEFVVPTLGFFCKLCSTFYVKENTSTQDPHCSSRGHYDRLREHYQELEEKSKPSRRSGRRTQGYISD